MSSAVLPSSVSLAQVLWVLEVEQHPQSAMDEPVRGLSANWKLLFGSMNSGR